MYDDPLHLQRYKPAICLVGKPAAIRPGGCVKVKWPRTLDDILSGEAPPLGDCVEVPDSVDDPTDNVPKPDLEEDERRRRWWSPWKKKRHE